MSAIPDTIKAAALKCTRCGACLQVCPVYRKEMTEASSARGRLYLLRALAEGRVDAKKALNNLVNLCTLCGACEVKCPSAVKTNALFLDFRKIMADSGQLPLAKKIAFTGLKYRNMFDFFMAFGSILQRLVMKKAPDGKGHVARFFMPAAGLTKRRLIPTLASRPLGALVPSRKLLSGAKAKVAFFPGCMLNYVYPENGKDIVGVLEANNVEVMIPEHIVCCGTPALTSGDFATARHLAEHNVKALAKESFDAVITGCATCGSALAQEYGHILEDSPVKGQWESMKNKVQDICQYLVKAGYSKDFRTVPLKVTYHDACHLVRHMKVSKEPREMLKAIPGIEFVEMKDADTCCGCAGIFSAANYPLSRAINDDKIDNAEATKADAVVVGCSACRMHILDGLGQRGSSMTALHTAEILARAYGRR